MKHLSAVVSILVAGLAPVAAGARGVTPYLPLNLAPEIERKVERVLILGGQPIVRRPIAAAVVLDALPEACKIDRALCAEVRAYLGLYMEDSGVTLARASAGVTTGDSDRALPNAHGRSVDSQWQLTASAYYQFNDYALLTGGSLAHDGATTPTGSTLSVGFDFAQLDIGYRDHWLSPLTDSSLLISTEAQTLPSVTLSNYQPISPLGFTYELFAARMSRQEDIRYFDGVTAGRPRLAGMQVGFAPAGGYAITLNRIMQYGGGARGGGGLSDLARAFANTNPVNGGDGAQGQEFGNQIASLAATQVIPARVPFAVRVEFAGEDNSYGGNYRLGDTALSLGIDLPLLLERYDFTFEATEWQNAWYVNGLYPRGMTHKGNVLGHWFGDQRQFGDSVGGWSAVLKAGYRTDRGDYWRAAYRTLDFVTSLGYQTLPEFPYAQLREFSLGYTTEWRGFPVSAEIIAGRDALGESFGRLSGTFDLAMGRGGRFPQSPPAERSASSGLELHIDVGAASARVFEILSAATPDAWRPRSTGYHVAVGARREVSTRGDLGLALELDEFDSRLMLSVRALDYRYRVTPRIALNGFFGVGRYEWEAPAYGWYMGAGVQWRNVLSRWDLGFDARYYDKLSRNRIAPGDPVAVIDRPRLHFDVESMTLYLSRHF
jgi:hypothetical protein